MYDNVFKIEFVKDNFNYEVMNFTANSTIFSEGDENNFVYFIEKGAIDVYKNGILIGVTKTSEFVGITSCLSDKQFYTFSAKSKIDSKILRLNKKEFKSAIEDKKEFCEYIMRILCERIKFTDLKTKSFLDKTYEKRLIFELITQSIFDGIKRKVIVNIDELYALTGIPKKIIQALLKNFIKENIISKSKSEFEILNFEKLQKSL